MVREPHLRLSSAGVAGRRRRAARPRLFRPTPEVAAASLVRGGLVPASLLLLLAALVVVGGCANTSAPGGGPGVRDGGEPIRGPGADLIPPAVHVVRRGDTLHAIAWRYALDYRDIAGWNGIAPPYLIYPDQELTLRGSAGAVASAPAAAPPRRRASAPVAPLPAAEKGRGNWVWPTKGRVFGSFGKAGNKGIDIAGRRGQAVVAAEAGRVVYNGSALSGYGRLVIIKHTSRLLTAYAHNERTLVREGDTVRAGQRIAEMGSTGTDRVKLHFEVRRDGKPVDPLAYLSG